MYSIESLGFRGFRQFRESGEFKEFKEFRVEGSAARTGTGAAEI